jgi:hypothetical protein
MPVLERFYKRDPKSKRIHYINFGFEDMQDIERNDIYDIIEDEMEDGYQYQLAIDNDGRIRSSAQLFTKEDFLNTDANTFGQMYVPTSKQFSDSDDMEDHIQFIYVKKIKIQ